MPDLQLTLYAHSGRVFKRKLEVENKVAALQVFANYYERGVYVNSPQDNDEPFEWHRISYIEAEWA